MCFQTCSRNVSHLNRKRQWKKAIRKYLLNWPALWIAWLVSQLNTFSHPQNSLSCALFESSSFSSLLVFPLSLVSAVSCLGTGSSSVSAYNVLIITCNFLAIFLISHIAILLTKEPNLHKVGLIIDFVLTVSFLFPFFSMFFHFFPCFWKRFILLWFQHLQDYPFVVSIWDQHRPCRQLLSLMTFCSYPYNLFFITESTHRNMGTCRRRLWFCVNAKLLRANITLFPSHGV